MLKCFPVFYLTWRPWACLLLWDRFMLHDGGNLSFLLLPQESISQDFTDLYCLIRGDKDTEVMSRKQVCQPLTGARLAFGNFLCCILFRTDKYHIHMKKKKKRVYSFNYCLTCVEHTQVKTVPSWIWPETAFYGLKSIGKTGKCSPPLHCARNNGNERSTSVIRLE